MKHLVQGLMIMSLTLIFSLAALAQSDADYKRQIEKMNKEMGEAMKAGDHDKNLQYYAEDVISLPNYDKMLKGKNELKKSSEEMASSGWKVKDFDTKITDLKSYGNLITEIGEYKIELTKDGMENSMKEEGKYLTLWEKQNDGSLKIKTEIWNSDKNPMESMKEMMDDQKGSMGERRMNDQERRDIEKSAESKEMRESNRSSDDTK